MQHETLFSHPCRPMHMSHIIWIGKECFFVVFTEVFLKECGFKTKESAQITVLDMKITRFPVYCVDGNHWFFDVLNRKNVKAISWGWYPSVVNGSVPVIVCLMDAKCVWICNGVWCCCKWTVWSLCGHFSHFLFLKLNSKFDTLSSRYITDLY